MIRNFEEHQPSIAANAYVDATALIIGQVSIGEHSSIWPMAILRGDINRISVGQYSNIQDGSVVHVNHAGEFYPSGSTVNVGDYVTVGHKVMLHGCTIKNNCLIGIGSIVMDDVIIHENTIIGANSLIPMGKELESGYLWLGSPVKKVRPLTEKELSYLHYSARYYADLATRHQRAYLKEGIA